ncbi:MAG: hypothetical protein ABJJ53_01060 [Sulfitobacter sp.]
MKRVLKIMTAVLVVLFMGLVWYGAVGYWGAVRPSDHYAARADAMMAGWQDFPYNRQSL